MNEESARFPCPCCGRLTFDSAPGSYDVCPVCFWEDDLSQLRWPATAGGANHPSLIEAQRNYATHGVSELRFLDRVRSPLDDEPMDDGWRPAVMEEDVEAPRTHSYPNDRLTLYWWRRNYWGRRE